MDLIATVRRFARFSAGPQRDMRLTTIESVAVAEVEPARYEASRAGRRFALGYSAAPTGKAPVQALATTAAQWTVWNGEPSGGKCYAFEELGVWNSSGTPGTGGQLYAAIFQAPASTGSSDTGMSVVSLSNGSSTSKAIVKSTITLTQPTAPIWFPVADQPSANAAAFPGTGFMSNREVRGAIVIPPQNGLGLYVLSPAGSTPLFVPWAVWCELETDLE